MVNNFTRRNYYVDALKMVFAILIVSLHINFQEEFPSIITCLSRIGVPFFFVTSGYFLTMDPSEVAIKARIIKYVKHSVLLLAVWYIIYSPITIEAAFILHGKSIPYTIIKIFQEFCFRTPAFLWYLTAGIVGAAILYGFRNKNKRKVAVIICGILYLLGTAGNSYLVFYPLIGKTIYYDVFLTTRNGVFFAFPLMMFGSLLHFPSIEKVIKHYAIIITVASSLLYIIEFYFIRAHTTNMMDTSMYIMLPFVTCMILWHALNFTPKVNFKMYHHFSDVSTGIYVMQFGFITLLSYFNVVGWLQWIGVAALATICSIIVIKTPKFIKILL